MAQKTPAQLTAQSTVADGDLFTGYPSGGPMYGIQASNLRTYMEALSLEVNGATAMTAQLPGFYGTEATPGYGFNGDADTGVYRVSANVGGLAAGGLTYLKWSATGLEAQNGAVFKGAISGTTTDNISTSLSQISSSLSSVAGNTGVSTSVSQISSSLSSTNSTVALHTSSLSQISSSLSSTNSTNVTQSTSLSQISSSLSGTAASLANVSTSLGNVSTSLGNVSTSLGSFASGTNANSLGYLGVPITVKSGSYTNTINDFGKEFYFNATATGTIDSNANVAAQIGSFLVYSVDAGHTLTVPITTDTLRWPGGGNVTGTRTVTGPGQIVMSKKLTTEWWVVGGFGIS